MVAEMECVAEIESRELRAEVKARFGRRVRFVSKKGRRSAAAASRRRTLYFLEIKPGAVIPVDPGLAELIYALAITKTPGTIPLPKGITAILHGKTVKQIANEMSQVIASLETAPEQCISSIRPGDDRQLEVEFLDGCCYSLELPKKWTGFTVSGDRRYLVAFDQHGSCKSIPWDYIRRPQYEIDELSKTQRRIGETLQQLREGSGLSQQIVAERSGLSRVTISRLENAEHLPGIKTLRALAKAYGKSLEELLALLRD